MGERAETSGGKAVTPERKEKFPIGEMGRATMPLNWTLRILSGISEGICNTMVQSGGEFLYIGVGGR